MNIVDQANFLKTSLIDLATDDIKLASMCAQEVEGLEGFGAWAGWINKCKNPANIFAECNISEGKVFARCDLAKINIYLWCR